jgi:hypothetical protein
MIKFQYVTATASIIIIIIIIIINNQEVQTDGQVLVNGLDTIIRKGEKFCLLMNVAISSDRNVIKKGTEKKLKYKNLSI